MSDSASESARPSDTTLGRTLKEQTRELMKLDNASINTIRSAVEEILGLEEGFFKEHHTWKARSKTIINNQVAELQAAPSSPPPVRDDLLGKQRKKVGRPSKATKRASPEDDEEEPPSKKPRRKRRAPAMSDSELSAVESVSSVEPKPKRTTLKTKAAASVKGRKRKPTTVESEPEDSVGEAKDVASGEDRVSIANDGRKEGKGQAKSDSEESHDEEVKRKESVDKETLHVQESVKSKESGSESEMSVLIDEEPKKRGRRSGSGSAPKTNKSTKAKKSNLSKSKDSDLSPDEAEIKRLQSWLVKCGIRKLWGRELKPFETNKQKIKHLKKMLEDAGMTGRYSLEKANQIKEQRELAADIEAVQEGAERWGKGDSGSGDEGRADGKPKRRLVQGRKNYDFLSSDGEETD